MGFVRVFEPMFPSFREKQGRKGKYFIMVYGTVLLHRVVV